MAKEKITTAQINQDFASFLQEQNGQETHALLYKWVQDWVKKNEGKEVDKTVFTKAYNTVLSFIIKPEAALKTLDSKLVKLEEELGVKISEQKNAPPPPPQAASVSKAAKDAASENLARIRNKYRIITPNHGEASILKKFTQAIEEGDISKFENFVASNEQVLRGLNEKFQLFSTAHLIAAKSASFTMYKYLWNKYSVTHAENITDADGNNALMLAVQNQKHSDEITAFICGKYQDGDKFNLLKQNSAGEDVISIAKEHNFKGRLDLEEILLNLAIKSCKTKVVDYVMGRVSEHVKRQALYMAIKSSNMPIFNHIYDSDPDFGEDSIKQALKKAVLDYKRFGVSFGRAIDIDFDSYKAPPRIRLNAEILYLAAQLPGIDIYKELFQRVSIGDGQRRQEIILQHAETALSVGNAELYKYISDNLVEKITPENAPNMLKTALYGSKTVLGEDVLEIVKDLVANKGFSPTYKQANYLPSPIDIAQQKYMPCISEYFAEVLRQKPSAPEIKESQKKPETFTAFTVRMLEQNDKFPAQAIRE